MIQESFMSIQSFFSAHPLVVAILVLWSLAWKGLALWKSAQLSHKTWFVVMLIANTMGLLEIIYIFFIAKKYEVVTEIQSNETQ